MLKQLMFVTLVGLVAAPAAALACGGKKEVTTVSVDKAKEMKPAFVDANSKETRTKLGVIPGAIMLTSYDGFDAGKELPKDKRKSLVFYCSNEMCSASKVAAGRAMEAGYSNVSVLPVGVKGWKAAGQKTVKPSDVGNS
ncbi:MAG: rhodanese-like domain-containing protein [Deltaproteobacteria bacterium]